MGIDDPKLFADWMAKGKGNAAQTSDAFSLSSFSSAQLLPMQEASPSFSSTSSAPLPQAMQLLRDRMQKQGGLLPLAGKPETMSAVPSSVVAAKSNALSPAMAKLQAAMAALQEATEEVKAEAEVQTQVPQPPHAGSGLTPAMAALQAATQQAAGQSREGQAPPMAQGMTPAMAALQAATQQAVGQNMEVQAAQTFQAGLPGVGGLPAGDAAAVTPAKRALMLAMQEMNNEMSGMSSPEQTAVMQGWPGLHMQSQSGAGSQAQQLDPQQLQLLQMQQMQAAWWMASTGNAGGPGAVIDGVLSAAPEPMVTPAAIAASQAPDLVTFGVGPSGPMDMSESAGGWRNPSGRDARVLTTEVSQPMVSTQRVYTGIVKAFDAVKKSGFIQCDEIRQHMQQDVYVFQDVLTRGSAGVTDHVCFALHISGKGKLQASSPLCRLSTHNGYALSGVFQLVGGLKNSKNSEDHMGVIDCFDVKRLFGRGVRVPKELGEKLHFGRRVAFNCTVDTEGICRAYAGETVADDYQVVPGDLSQSWSFPGFEPKIYDGRHGGSSSKGTPPAPGAPGMGFAGLGADDGHAAASGVPPAAFALRGKGLPVRAPMKVTGRDDGTGPWATKQEANSEDIKRRVEELRALRDRMNEKRKEEGFEPLGEEAKRLRAHAQFTP